jgi:hypothetical protein
MDAIKRANFHTFSVRCYIGGVSYVGTRSFHAVQATQMIKRRPFQVQISTFSIEVAKTLSAQRFDTPSACTVFATLISRIADCPIFFLFFALLYFIELFLSAGYDLLLVNFCRAVLALQIPDP